MSLGRLRELRKRLAKKSTSNGSESGGDVEGEGGDTTLDLSKGGLDEREQRTRVELSRIVDDVLGSDPALHKIADEIARRGFGALRLWSALGDEKVVARPDVMGDMEVIARADGSRPSFLIQNDRALRASSPVGDWAAALDASELTQLTAAIRCVGRIDDPSASEGFRGTGFLVHEDLVVTNRHVLQEIAAQNTPGQYTFSPEVAIDFGHEFRADGSTTPRPRRAIESLVYAGPKAIPHSPVDHARLDIAVLKLAPLSTDQPREPTLAIDISPDWSEGSPDTFVIGYPGRPAPTDYPLDLLERLFQVTWGRKRLAPGRPIDAASGIASRSFAHDATTLGGNSGSVVLVVGREGAAAGLHYGGTRGEPRENWGHKLGLCLDEPDPISGSTLREVLTRFGVVLVDRKV